MKNIINKIKNLTLEQVNKNLIFIAILSLLFRIGSFTANYNLKPFEIIFMIIVILTTIDLIKNKKIKEFFFSIPKNIRIALSILLFSVLLGWFVAVFIKNIPTSFNMILEFGNFVIAIGIFLLIIFYTRNDKAYIKKYLYALLISTIYIICLIFPIVANYFNLISGVSGVNFVGFTTNENIISKILLIPSIFFICISLFKNKYIWLQIFYILISSGLVALLFWVSSRAALISLIIGCIFVWLVFSFNKFKFNKLFNSGIIIFIIILMGFTISPHSSKQIFLNRILNLDGSQLAYGDLKEKSLLNIIRESFFIKKIKTEVIILPEDKEISESRFQFWPIYLKQILKNPLGFGPNPHIEIDYYYKGGKLNLGPHNTYIEVLLWGGALGFFGFAYVIFSAFKNLKNQLKSNFNIIIFSLISILFTTSIVIIANDSISLISFWIVLSLSLITTADKRPELKIVN